MNEEKKMKLRINDRVTWSCLAGHLTGTVVDIVLDLNAAQQVVPWIDIKTERTTVRICGSDMGLKQLSVAKLETA
jgi:hypothetical protein